MEKHLIKKVTTLVVIFLILGANFVSRVQGSMKVEVPLISSEAAIIIDEKTGRILYDKNSNQKMSPASLTKVATAIYAIERGNLEDIVTISKNAREVEGTRVFLEEGEKVTLRKLIQGLLVNSGNDAGVAIAEHLDGSVKLFSTSINKFLDKIGIQNTNFVNPHGLYDPDHKTTAQDLAKITKYALQNKEFRKIFGLKELNWDGESWDTTLYSHHKLMRERPYEGITGGKTGYVDESGITLITTATRNDLSVIVVTLKAQTEDMAYSDTVDLLDYAFEHFESRNIPMGKVYKIDNRTYKTKEKLDYTISQHETVRQSISEKGHLEVLNQNQVTIASFQLEKVKNNINKNVTFKDTREESKLNKDESVYTKFSVMFIFILFISLKFIQKKKLNNIN
nr:D-alanyl-D-alanine carboxypeptidase family protein [Lysinibacillus sphaericus]